MSTTGYLPTDESIDSAVDVRRFANDAIRDAARRFDGWPVTTFDFLCECGDLRCDRIVKLTPAEYDRTKAGSVRDH
jgi:hypothetical protein